jgi:hypothetical protein
VIGSTAFGVVIWLTRCVHGVVTAASIGQPLHAAWGPEFQQLYAATSSCPSVHEQAIIEQLQEDSTSGLLHRQRAVFAQDEPTGATSGLGVADLAQLHLVPTPGIPVPWCHRLGPEHGYILSASATSVEVDYWPEAALMTTEQLPWLTVASAPGRPATKSTMALCWREHLKGLHGRALAEGLASSSTGAALLLEDLQLRNQPLGQHDRTILSRWERIMLLANVTLTSCQPCDRVAQDQWRTTLAEICVLLKGGPAIDVNQAQVLPPTPRLEALAGHSNDVHVLFVDVHGSIRSYVNGLSSSEGTPQAVLLAEAGFLAAQPAWPVTIAAFDAAPKPADRCGQRAAKKGRGGQTSTLPLTQSVGHSAEV